MKLGIWRNGSICIGEDSHFGGVGRFFTVANCHTIYFLLPLLYKGWVCGELQFLISHTVVVWVFLILTKGVLYALCFFVAFRFFFDSTKVFPFIYSSHFNILARCMPVYRLNMYNLTVFLLD